VRDRLRLAVAAAARQSDTQTTIAIIGEAERRGLSSNELFAVALSTGPNPPAAYPSPAGRATRADRLRPLGLEPTGHAAKPSAWSSRSATVTGPLAQRRQPRRRRITPNTNTSTTTTISTHNHVDMAASLVDAGAVQADATAAHPSKQLGHRQASSRARIDGRAPHRLAGPRHPATCRRSRLAGLVPDRQPTTRRPRWG
jgi:hypothetical protein